MKYAALAVAVMVACSGVAFSQESQPPQPTRDATTGSTRTPVINKRQRNQQRRIARGVKGGQLTAGEAARLETREAKIQKDKQAAKADGKVTPAERRKLRREENRASRKIYKLKHNEKTQNP